MEVSVDLVLTYFLKYFTYHLGAINKYESLVNCPFVCSINQKKKSSTTIYNDYVVSETQFHWQSQVPDAAPWTKSETPVIIPSQPY